MQLRSLPVRGRYEFVATCHFTLLLFVNNVTASPYLRHGLGNRNLLPQWMCSFFDDTASEQCQKNETQPFTNDTIPTCPLVEPSAVFDMANFTSHSWYVQKQQINGFQPSVQEDFYCLVHTFQPRPDEDRFWDYLFYGTQGSVDGPPQEWDVGDLPPEWCAGQDEEGGGFLRISPCLLRFLLSRVGVPLWVVDVAPDYSWAIWSGGPPEELRQWDPPLCTTRTNVSADVLADTSGAGLWLVTQERIASDETIAEMEDVLFDMGIYAGDLYPVVQEGCNYTGAILV